MADDRPRHRHLAQPHASARPTKPSRGSRVDQARVPDFAALARQRRGSPRARAQRLPRATQKKRPQPGAPRCQAPDALVVIGDDQDEWFSADSQPASASTGARRSKTCHRPSSARRPYAGLLGLLRRRHEPRIPDAALGRHHRDPHARARLRRHPHPVQPKHAPFGRVELHQRLMGDKIVPSCPYPEHLLSNQ